MWAIVRRRGADNGKTWKTSVRILGFIAEAGLGHPAIMTEPRRMPPPWSIEECNGQCFIVRDANGRALAYVYFEDNAARRAAAGDSMTRDEARRVALNIAKLPELQKKPRT